MTEAQANAMNLGREAALGLQVTKPILDEAVDALIRNALMAFRGGTLTAERALVFVGKLDALCGLEEELSHRIRLGEYASAESRLVQESNLASE